MSRSIWLLGLLVLIRSIANSGAQAQETGVDPASGQFSLSIPLHVVEVRGDTVPIVLNYSSRIWAVDPSGPWIPQDQACAGVSEPFRYNEGRQWLEDYSAVGLGFDINLGRLRGWRYCMEVSEQDRCWYRFAFQSPDGRTIMFVSDNPEYANGGADSRFIALDDSGASLLVSGSQYQVVLGGLVYNFGDALLNREGNGFGGGPALEHFEPGGAGVPGLGDWELARKISVNGRHLFLRKPDGDYFGIFGRFAAWARSISDQARQRYLGLGGFGGTTPTTSYMLPPPIAREDGSAAFAATSIGDLNGNLVTISYYDNPGSSDESFKLGLPQAIVDSYGRTIHFEAENATETFGGSGSYPKVRLRRIHSEIGPSGSQELVFGYVGDESDPYLLVDSGPFGEQPIQTRRGNGDTARRRLRLRTITANPGADPQPEVTRFEYNSSSELNRVISPTGVIKTLTYGQIATAACSSTGEPYRTGYEPRRVVSSVAVDAYTGQMATTDYTYDIPTGAMQIGVTTELNQASGLRTIYEFFTTDPFTAYLTPPHAQNPLAGLLSKITRFDSEGVTLEEEQYLYESLEGGSLLAPEASFGNIWTATFQAGKLTHGNGAWKTQLRGIGLLEGDWNDAQGAALSGYATRWILESDGWALAASYGPGLANYMIQLVNPMHVSLRRYHHRAPQFDASGHDPYVNRGLWGLVTSVDEGEVRDPDFDGFLFSEGTTPGVLPSVLDPADFSIMTTTTYTYDGQPLVAACGGDAGTTVRGLLTRKEIVQTGAYTSNRYYTNGLLYSTLKPVLLGGNPSLDLGSTKYYQYNTGPSSTGNCGMLSSESLVSPNYGAHTRTVTRNSVGQVLTSVDVENGETSATTYDVRGRPTERYSNGTLVSFTTYQDDHVNGAFRETTLVAGPAAADRHITRTYFDRLGRETSSRERAGDEPNWITKEQQGYDAAGRLAHRTPTQPYGNQQSDRTSYYTYDPLGRLLSATDPLGRVVTGAINEDVSPWELGNVQRSTSWGAFSEEGRDHRGNILYSLTQLSDSTWAATNFEYDEGGRLILSQSAEGLVTRYYYDALGRLVAEDLPDETSNFSLVRGSDFTYPLIDPPGGARADNITEAFTLTGAALRRRTSRGFFHMTYDDLGRVTRVQHSVDRDGARTMIEDHSYLEMDAASPAHARGRLTRSRYYDAGGSLNYVIRYGYDAAGRVAEQLVTLGDMAGAKRIRFTYDPLGRITGLTYPEGDLLSYLYRGSALKEIRLNGGPLVGLTYDAFRRLSSRTLGSNVRVSLGYDNRTDQISAFSVSRRALKNLVPAIDSPSAESLESSQAISEASTLNSPAVSFSFSTPRAVSDQLSSAVGSRLPSWSTLLSERYGYSLASGALETIVDAATGENSQIFSYDLAGRLTAVELNDVDYDPASQELYFANSFSTRIHYGLDGDNRRTSKTSIFHDPALSTDTLSYNYTPGTHRLSSVTRGGGAVFIQEFNEAGDVTSYDGEEMTRNEATGEISSFRGETYGYAGGIRVRRTRAGVTTYALMLGLEVLVEYDQSGNVLKKHFAGDTGRVATFTPGVRGMQLLVKDTRGDLRLVVADTGLLQSKFQYAPFGEIINTGSGNLPVGVPGYDGYLAEATGLSYAYARDYDQKTGVFLRTDPARASINPYDYSHQNPIALRDPTGLNPDERPPFDPLGAFCEPGVDRACSADSAWAQIEADSVQTKFDIIFGGGSGDEDLFAMVGMMGTGAARAAEYAIPLGAIFRRLSPAAKAFLERPEVVAFLASWDANSTMLDRWLSQNVPDYARMRESYRTPTVWDLVRSFLRDRPHRSPYVTTPPGIPYNGYNSHSTWDRRP